MKPKSSQPTNSQPKSVHFHLRRISWYDDDGNRCALFVAGTDQGNVSVAAYKLSEDICLSLLTPVSNEELVSSNLDMDDLPF